MQEAWIQLRCPDCEKAWEANATELPTPETTFRCDGCGSSRSLSEFLRTARDLEILEQFQ